MFRLLGLAVLALLLASCVAEEIEIDRTTQLREKMSEIDGFLYEDFPSQQDETTLPFLVSIDRWRGAEYSVDFVATSATSDGQLTTFGKQEYHSAFRTRVDTVREDTAYRSYVLNANRFVSCTNPANWRCQNLPNNPNDGLQGFFRSLLAANRADGQMTVYNTTGRLIFDQPAMCYIIFVDVPDEQSTHEFCTLEEVPIYLKSLDEISGTVVEYQPVHYGVRVIRETFDLPARPV